jgi:dephospho-CoA kinase
MLVVGLTGGIGSGKSTFAALLLERGAQIIDADLLGRDALKPGRPAWHSVVDQFGDEILVPGALEIDRQRLARVVFGDRGKLQALNVIVHPVIMKGIADQLDHLANTDDVVVIDAALIVETGLKGVVDVLIVVTADDEARRDRLIAERGMDARDIDARIASQTPQERLVAEADIVVNNDGSIEELADEADRVWADLSRRAEK